MISARNVLLVWWYARKDLTEPLFKLSDNFLFTGLFYNNKKQDIEIYDHFPYNKIYWNDFSTPGLLLDKVKPELIIFMGIDNAKPIALRIAAAKKKIPCIVIEHGIKNNIDWVENEFKNKRITFRSFYDVIIKKTSDIFRTFYFLSDVMSIHKLSLTGKLLRLLKYQTFLPIDLALNKVKFEERTADKYFLFGPFQSRLYQERDGVPENKIKYIGSIFHDDFFQKYKNAQFTAPIINEKYSLIIDQPLVEITLSERLEIYSRISNKMRTLGFKTMIKLHPLDYCNYNELAKSLPDVIWIKDCDMVSMVYHSSYCFGFYSTMLILLIALKDCFILDLFNLPLINSWIDKKVVYPIRHLEEINSLDKYFLNPIRWENRKEFICNYLLSIEGNASQLLKKEINVLLFKD